jgi:hypothetical protein
VGLQADARYAAIALLADYGVAAGIKLQSYPGRPKSIAPPCAFVDLIHEHLEYTGPTLRQRVPVVEVIVVHGIYDTKEAADQKDAFVDGFLDWVNVRYHAMGANTTIGVTDTEDLPNYVPEWMPPDRQLVYYATRISLEGLALG